MSACATCCDGPFVRWSCSKCVSWLHKQQVAAASCRCCSCCWCCRQLKLSSVIVVRAPPPNQTGCRRGKLILSLFSVSSDECIRKIGAWFSGRQIRPQYLHLSINQCRLSAFYAYGVITTTIKHAIKLTLKLKTSPGPAKLAWLLVVAAISFKF